MYCVGLTLHNTHQKKVSEKVQNSTILTTARTTIDPLTPPLPGLLMTQHLPVLITWPAMLVPMVTTVLCLCLLFMFRTRENLFLKLMDFLNTILPTPYLQPLLIYLLMKCYRDMNTTMMVIPISYGYCNGYGPV